MNEKKLNILFLSSWYPNRLFPSLGNFVQKHAECVALKSNVAALFVFSDPNCKEKFEIVESTLNNVYTVNVYYRLPSHNFPVLFQLRRAFRYFRAHKKGLEIINSKFGKIDLVHHNILYRAGIIAWWLKKTQNLSYIITENWTGYLSSKKMKFGILQTSLSKMIARNASFITPVSKDLRDSMLRLGFNSNYEIVYNVVDTILFHPLDNKSKERKIKLLHVSTLDDPHKNISGMLRVISELVKRRSDFEMLFVGEGDKTKHIKTATELGIYNSFVFFDGVKKTAEVADIMRNSDCFVMFSNYENLPCVIIEALASGLPIVSSTAGGIPEHITERMGFLVEPLDEKALLESINKAIDNIRSDKYNPKELSDYSKNNFSYEKVSEKFHELYYEVLKK